MKATRTLLVGAAAGYVSGLVMDKATTWFYERQSDASKQREGELLPEGAPMASARKLAGLVGAEPTDERAGQIALGLHQSLGQVYGVAAAALTRAGVPPIKAGLVGAEPTDERAGQIALGLHQSLGQVYGVAAAALTRAGVPPIKAGLVSGLAGFLLVDELANSLFFTPPPQAYPVESHLRGVVGHLTFGATCGVILAVASRLRLLAAGRRSGS
jgi:hypothetical protein